MEGQTLDIYANGWGVTLEEMVAISQREWETLREFLEKVGETTVRKLDEGEIQWANGKDNWLRASVHAHETTFGGNALNSASAIFKVLGVLDPAARERVHFHAFKTPELSNLTFPTVLREVSEAVRMRIAYVVKGPNGDDPLYWSVPPTPAETGPLPDTPNVLISSSGTDVYREILDYRCRNPRGKVFLAPGSAQVKRGIPAEVLEQIHFLSCNRKEALTLAEHIAPKKGGQKWTIDDLLKFFRDTGLSELRITAGAEGIHGLSDRASFFVPGFDRDDERVQRLAAQLWKAGVATERTFAHPDANGCGDTRLGVELGLGLAGENLERRQTAGNLIAVLHTFNSAPNIDNFPDEVIEQVMELLPRAR